MTPLEQLERNFTIAVASLLGAAAIAGLLFWAWNAYQFYWLGE